MHYHCLFVSELGGLCQFSRLHFNLLIVECAVMHGGGVRSLCNLLII